MTTENAGNQVPDRSFVIDDEDRSLFLFYVAMGGCYCFGTVIACYVSEDRGEGAYR
ncbi:MAG TPA: hypothetical protein VEK79_18705 [Thermoanaerobaculia bacterium]|nr:hypothetical protein [Thermoanaerobaculia bacterium]